MNLLTTNIMLPEEELAMKIIKYFIISAIWNDVDIQLNQGVDILIF